MVIALDKRHKLHAKQQQQQRRRRRRSIQRSCVKSRFPCISKYSSHSSSSHERRLLVGAGWCSRAKRVFHRGRDFSVHLPTNARNSFLTVEISGCKLHSSRQFRVTLSPPTRISGLMLAFWNVLTSSLDPHEPGRARLEISSFFFTSQVPNLPLRKERSFPAENHDC